MTTTVVEPEFDNRPICRTRKGYFADCFVSIGEHKCGGELMKGVRGAGYAVNYVECSLCGWHMFINKG